MIPIAGSFLVASHMGHGLLDLRAGAYLVALLDSSVQAAGIVMLMVGLLSPRRWLERDGAKPLVTLMPGAPGAPLGASLGGQF